MLDDLISNYGTRLYKHFGQHAAWPPGSDVRIGDYGIVRDSCFKRLGSISYFKVKLKGSELRHSVSPQWHFVSDRVSSQRADAGTGKLFGSLLIQFGEKFSIFLKARDATEQDISNLNELGHDLKNAPGWNRAWKVVTGLTSASTFCLLVSSSPNSNVRIEASSQVLDQFEIGSVSASAEYNLKGSTGFQLLGQSGPILVHLHQLSWFSRTLGSGGTQLPDLTAKLVPPPSLSDDPEALDMPEKGRGFVT